MSHKSPKPVLPTNATAEQKRVYYRWYDANVRDRKKTNEAVQARRLEIKRTVMGYYSNGVPHCACCGEDVLMFLTVDHVNNDGCEHRKKVAGGKTMYAWLLRNGYPEGYQVLCFNCNTGRSLNGGICPHQL